MSKQTYCFRRARDLYNGWGLKLCSGFFPLVQLPLCAEHQGRAPWEVRKESFQWRNNLLWSVCCLRKARREMPGAHGLSPSREYCPVAHVIDTNDLYRSGESVREAWDFSCSCLWRLQVSFIGQCPGARQSRALSLPPRDCGTSDHAKQMMEEIKQFLPSNGHYTKWLVGKQQSWAKKRPEAAQSIASICKNTSGG